MYHHAFENLWIDTDVRSVIVPERKHERRRKSSTKKEPHEDTEPNGFSNSDDVVAGLESREQAENLG